MYTNSVEVDTMRVVERDECVLGTYLIRLQTEIVKRKEVSGAVEGYKRQTRGLEKKKT